jgi:hypothetical protein
LLRKYSLSFVIESIKAGFSTYNGDLERTLKKLPGICIIRSDPTAEKISYLLNIFNKKFENFDRSLASRILHKGYAIGGDEFLDDAVRAVANGRSTSWASARNKLYTLLEEWSGV